MGLLGVVEDQLELQCDVCFLSEYAQVDDIREARLHGQDFLLVGNFIVFDGSVTCAGKRHGILPWKKTDGPCCSSCDEP